HAGRARRRAWPGDRAGLVRQPRAPGARAADRAVQARHPVGHARRDRACLSRRPARAGETVNSLALPRVLEMTPALAPMYRLQYESAQDSWVLLYPEGMVRLNGPASEIPRRCDGEARAMGAVQLGLSGGEPLLRDDLEEIVAHAHGLGFYINLITSGVGLTEARARALKEAGLDHIQLSFQDSTRELNDFLSSTRTFELKSKVAAIIKKLGYPMVLNCVMHRYNLPHVGRIIAMAESMGAEFLELANTQYYGWAWLNRDALMPTREDLADAEAIVDHHRARLAGRMKIL